MRGFSIKETKENNNIAKLGEDSDQKKKILTGFKSSAGEKRQINQNEKTTQPPSRRLVDHNCLSKSYKQK